MLLTFRQYVCWHKMHEGLNEEEATECWEQDKLDRKARKEKIARARWFCQFSCH